MPVKSSVHICLISICCFLSIAASPATAPSTPPNATQAIVADLRSSDAARVDSAVAAMKKLIATGHAPDAFWKNWLPQLMRIKHYADAADLAQRASLLTPFPNAIGPFMSFRAQALLALGKPADALVAAKSYYNVCDIRDTAAAIKLVGDCLARARPNDPGIAAKFQDEQAQASAGTIPPAAPILQSVVIDLADYQSAIDSWQKKSQKVSDRNCYANLLLVADRAKDAEEVFRGLYQSAKTTADLASATEGLARSLRAEDGNLARANAWLASLQAAK